MIQALFDACPIEVNSLELCASDKLALGFAVDSTNIVRISDIFQTPERTGRGKSFFRLRMSREEKL
jgi:hypothetical protein